MPVTILGAKKGTPSKPQKPPYRIPTMAEIAAVPWNGYTAVSTFSGCGGSCLGYRWAGFKVAWASEFIPAAAETYRANHPTSILDTRDVREVKGSEILAAIGKKVGQIDFFDGSPPCASFSLSGKREAGWGQVKTYSDTKQRTDDLFFEYIRLVDETRPRVFAAENVRGLVIGTAKGYCKDIIRRMKAIGYRVGVRVLDAKYLGVPQGRTRTIFVGVREDLEAEPRHPKPLPYRYTLRDACPWITKAVHDTSGDRSSGEFTDRPVPAITVGVHSVNSRHYQVHGEDRAALEKALEEASFVGYALEREWGKLRPGESSDKYINLIRAHPDRPSPTVTQTAGNPGAAGVTHPFEPRKFTIAELRRVCGFPDDFVLTGTYQQQWERCGRAVPPPMSYAVGCSVAEILREVDGRKKKPRRAR